MGKRRKGPQKVTKQNELSVNPFELDMVQVAELRRKLAKRANQRLVRLERAKLNDEAGTRASDLAPAQYAYEQIRRIRGEGSKRFRENKMAPGASPESQRMELYALQDFLGQPGSRAGQVQRQVSKTQATFQERGITIASYKSFYNFLNSANFSFLKSQGFDSETIIEMLQEAKEGKQSWKAINEIITEYVKHVEEEKAANEDYQPSDKELAERLNVKLIDVRKTHREVQRVKRAQEKRKRG